MHRISRPFFTIGLLAITTGCSSPKKGTDDAPYRQDKAAEEDKSAYLQLAESLKTKAQVSKISSDVTSLRGSTSQFYHLEPLVMAPTVIRRNSRDSGLLRYKFSVGSGDDVNFEASDRMIATAENRTGKIRVHTTEADGRLLGEINTPPLTGDAKWPAYSVSEGAVYFLTEEGGNVTVGKWRPDTNTSEALTTFAQDRANFGEIWALGADDLTLVITGTNGAWRVDLESFAVLKLEAKDQPGGHFSILKNEIIFETQRGELLWNKWGAGQETVNLSTLIADNSYRLNGGYASAHFFNGEEFCRWQDWLVYRGNLGIFAYHLVTNIIMPLQLVPLSDDERVHTTLSEPVVSGDGILLMRTTKSGYLGSLGAADILELDLNRLLL